MVKESTLDTFDYVIVGSGFGGSVSALRLAQKGYAVAVLEQGRRFRDQDFAKSTWNLRRYLWAPKLGLRGILQISPFKDVFVLHGAGVGGGSLGYANVLMQPSDEAFESPAWKGVVEWGRVLQPHYAEAKRMLGVATNPRLTPADHVLKGIAEDMGRGDTFRPVETGTFFGESGQEGVEVPDPYFGGEGPARKSCIHCGGCMVGCRHNAKNTLPKNYLHLAEKLGVTVFPDTVVKDIRPLAADGDGARYEVRVAGPGWFHLPRRPLRARNVIVAAGALGTLRLLFRCRDVTRSLPDLSLRLGDRVRTNSEALLGSVARRSDVDYSKGIAITSIFQADAITTVEPCRYPAGSSLMRFLSGPVTTSGGFLSRACQSAYDILRRPGDFLRTHVRAGWAEAATILLVMQWEDNRLRLRPGRSLFTFGRRDLVSEPDGAASLPPPKVDVGHAVLKKFAEETGGIAMGSINEGLFNIPLTAHILGGVPFGTDAEEGVIGADCQVHGHPGLFVVDGSILPANPGVNPSLTITAMAEYAMSLVAAKEA
ncbi:MAG: GMC family oxidoreductase [Holophagaceae bacterium]|nr:GMC family oxidoreductase [Holophagaceae bacterium]